MLDSECPSCNACCREAVVPPFTPEELESLPESLSEPIRRVWSHAANPESNFWDQTGRRECSWLDLATGLCRHYDDRPQECRDFEIAGDDCRKYRERFGINTPTVPLTVSMKGNRNAETND